MIEYINVRLNDWARWRASGRALYALGARSCWPLMLGDADSTETVRQVGTLVPFNDLECERTERAVNALPKELRDLVIELYCRIGPIDTVMRRLRICKTMLYRRIDQAHVRLDQCLSPPRRLIPGASIAPMQPSLGALVPGSMLAPGEAMSAKTACIQWN